MAAYHMNTVCEYEVTFECILFEIFSARDFGKTGISGQIGVIGPFFGPKQLFKSFSTKRRRKQFVK